MEATNARIREGARGRRQALEATITETRLAATMAAAAAAAESTQLLEAERRRATDAARAASAAAEQQLEAERDDAIVANRCGDRRETTIAEMRQTTAELEQRVEAETGRAETLAAELVELRQQVAELVARVRVRIEAVDLRVVDLALVPRRLPGPETAVLGG